MSLNQQKNTSLGSKNLEFRYQYHSWFYFLPSCPTMPALMGMDWRNKKKQIKNKNIFKN